MVGTRSSGAAAIAAASGPDSAAAGTRVSAASEMDVEFLPAGTATAGTSTVGMGAAGAIDDVAVTPDMPHTDSEVRKLVSIGIVREKETLTYLVTQRSEQRCKRSSWT